MGGILQSPKSNLLNNFLDSLIYDHGIDQRGYKWSSNKKLKKVSNNFLPKYILDNLDKYRDWLD